MILQPDDAAVSNFQSRDLSPSSYHSRGPPDDVFPGARRGAQPTDDNPPASAGARHPAAPAVPWNRLSHVPERSKK